MTTIVYGRRLFTHDPWEGTNDSWKIINCKDIPETTFHTKIVVEQSQTLQSSQIGEFEKHECNNVYWQRPQL